MDCSKGLGSGDGILGILGGRGFKGGFCLSAFRHLKKDVFLCFFIL